jgi:hypothetical protein
VTASLVVDAPAATVLGVAWASSGSPSGAVASVGREGNCARCGLAGRLVAVRSVVSKVFTGFDDWVDPTAWGVCEACAWGHTTPALRSMPHLVERTGRLRSLTRAETGHLLVDELGPGACLVVPLRAGRKHVLPGAVWGRVCVDDAHLPWTSREVRLLELVSWLRELGFGSRMLLEDAPAYGVFAKLDPALWGQVQEAWTQLAVWRRSDGPWMALAVHVTAGGEGS